MLNEFATRFWKVSEDSLGHTKCSITLASNYFSQNYLSHLLYKLRREHAVGNPFAIEGQTANMNSQMRLWARCSMSLLPDSERSLKSLLAKTKCSITLASNYFSQNYLSHLLYKLCCERAVGNPFAIEGQTANMNSQTRFWARCSTSLLLDSERSLKILLAIRNAVSHLPQTIFLKIICHIYCINYVVNMQLGILLQ